MPTKVKNKNAKNIFENAVRHFEKGNLSEAEKLFKQILNSDPKMADAWYHLGLIANRVRKIKDALGLIYKAIEIDPKLDYILNMGNILYGIENYDEAIRFYQKSIALYPEETGGYNNLGAAWERKGETDKAIECYQKVLELKPDNADVYSNLGVAYNRKNMTEEAINSYFKALELNPGHVDANYNLGIAYKDSWQVDKAIEYYEKALEINPNYSDVYLNLGIAYLLKQDFEKGWKYYEHRYNRKTPPMPKLSNPKPKWDGSSLEGMTVYVYHEQGMGDTIQFARYAQMLYNYGAKKVLLKCQAGLERLLKQSNLNVEIINYSTPDEIVEFDCYVPLLSLPYHLKFDLDVISQITKYLKTDINDVLIYKHKFFNNDKFKVGIFWQGSTDNKDDKNRSISLDYYYPLFDLPDVQFYSLQKGFGIEQLNDVPENYNIINLGETFNDFSHTAAAIENLDLVITIDSSIAHVAGGLGKPVWVLLQSSLEWRWFRDEEKTAWYESMRLFRPEYGQDRREVIERIKTALIEKFGL